MLGGPSRAKSKWEHTAAKRVVDGQQRKKTGRSQNGPVHGADRRLVVHHSGQR
jgi:hypothetical protein